IHFRAAPAWPAAEDDQQRTQADRAKQRDEAELEERCGAEVDHRERRHQREADERTLGVSDEQRHVAKRIRTAQQNDEADGGDDMSGGEQRTIAVDATQAPDEGDEMKAEEIERAPQQELIAKLGAAADDERWLDRREVRRREQRERLGNRASRGNGRVS